MYNYKYVKGILKAKTYALLIEQRELKNGKKPIVKERNYETVREIAFEALTTLKNINLFDEFLEDNACYREYCWIVNMTYYDKATGNCYRNYEDYMNNITDMQRMQEEMKEAV